eukprot:863366_1
MAVPVRREDSCETVNTSSSGNTVNSNIKPHPYKWCKDILEQQGITDYDEAILDILHDYSYQYLSSILQEAAENVLHRTESAKDAIDIQDIDFAKRQIQKRKTYSPNLLQMMEDAAQVNRIPLPFVSHHHKMKLPPKPYRLTSRNYQIDYGDKDDNKQDNDNDIQMANDS